MAVSLNSLYLRGPLGSTETTQRLVVLGAIAFMSVWAIAAFLSASSLLILMVPVVLLCVGIAVLRGPITACVIWMMIAGSSPEMWLGDIIPGSENTDTAVVKVAGLILVGVCMVRYGPRLDVINPGWAYLVMFFVGLVHGLLPPLTVGESARSLIGGAAPFAFSFSRLDRRWCDTVIKAVIWVPPVIVVFGAFLDVAGLRPIVMSVGFQVRLAGSTHPAFLGTFAMTSIYAALMELYREGKRLYLWALGLDLLILLGSGARSPLFCAVVVVGVSMIFLRSERFPMQRRILPFLLGGMAVSVAASFASGSSSIRILSVLSDDAGDLNGRGQIWPLFERAWDASPWLGWGCGAGKVVLDPNSLLAHLLGTTAAHNEYLRIGVEGGYFGLFLLIVLIAAWSWRGSARARRSDRFILRLAILMFAVQSATDNTLIAATASVYFMWASAVFARAGFEWEAAREGRRRRVLRPAFT